MNALPPNVSLRWKIDRLAKAIDMKLADDVGLRDESDCREALRLREILVSRKALAEFSGITADTITNIEIGRTNNRETIGRYFQALVAYIDSLSEPEQAIPRWIDFPVGTWVNGSGSLCGMMDPELRSVAFHGKSRAAMLTKLTDWCRSDAPVAIRSLTADAGMGKTRLGVELCRNLPAGSASGGSQDWVSGFVRPQWFPQEQSPWSTARLAGRNLLMIFDYAGSPEVLPVIKRLLPHLLAPPTAKVRILFLDRTDYWLAGIRAEKAFEAVRRQHSFSRDFSESNLGDPYDGGGGRQEAFRKAAEGFRSKLGIKGRHPDPTGLDAPEFNRVLLLHLRALLEVTGSTKAEKIEDLLDECMDRERRQWYRRMEVRGLKEHHAPAVEGAFFQISAEGGAVDAAAAVDIARGDRVFDSLPPNEREAVIGVLHDCYASSQRYIEPLRPDLMGEHFIAKPPPRKRHVAKPQPS